MEASKGHIPHMSWYQDHEESCSCEGLPRQGENHQLLPETSLTALKMYEITPELSIDFMQERDKQPRIPHRLDP